MEAVLAVVRALYPDSYSAVVGCIMQNGGRMRESDVAVQLELAPKVVRAVANHLANDGLVHRESAPNKDKKPVANTMGSVGPAWSTKEDDAFVSVDRESFERVFRYRTTAMLRALAPASDVAQKYVCSNAACLNYGTTMTVMDLLRNPAAATRGFICPRRECKGAPVKPVGLSLEQAADMKRRFNMQLGPLLARFNAPPAVAPEGVRKREEVAAEEPAAKRPRVELELTATPAEEDDEIIYDPDDK